MPVKTAFKGKKKSTTKQARERAKDRQFSALAYESTLACLAL